MKNHLLLISFIGLSIIASCSQKETQQNVVKEVQAENIDPTSLDHLRVKYQNKDMSVDLGVGLWAWPIPMDYDQDGDLDLVVSCPDVPFNGTYFFENPTGDVFPTFNPPVKISKGSKNLQVSYPNNEPRVTVGNMEYKDFLNTQLDNGVPLFDADSLEKTLKKIRFKQWKWVDYENDGDMDIIIGMDSWGDYGWDNAFNDKGVWVNGPLHGFVYLIENVDEKYSLKGKVEAAGKPIDVYGAPSPNFADFDGDGDLDIICGEFIDKMTWFENIGSRNDPIYSAGRLLANQSGILKMDLQMIIPTAIDWDKDGDQDLIVGDEDGRVAWVENTGKVKDHMPVFNSPRYFQQKADNVKFGALVTPVAVDWDDDGDDDLICGNTAGYVGFIENLDGANPPNFAKPIYLNAGDETLRILAGPSGSIQGPCEAKWGYTTLSVADWDGDGLRDVIVNSIWGKVLWYKNVGEKQKPKLGTARPVQVDWPGEIPKPKWNWWSPQPNELSTQWRTTPVAIDWNQDGLMDLVMLDHEGYLAFFERFDNAGKLVLKPGKRIFKSTNNSAYKSRHQVVDNEPGLLRLNASENGGSGRRKFCFTDWDSDGDLDLLVNSESIHFLENSKTEDGFVYFTDQGAVTDSRLAGHTTSPTVVDWDKDGKPELLVGAEDGHFYYLGEPE
ncbi:MAG: VCBS repeat-containing protein [Cyclobacteriaceae bacterium]